MRLHFVAFHYVKIFRAAVMFNNNWFVRKHNWIIDLYLYSWDNNWLTLKLYGESRGWLTVAAYKTFSIAYHNTLQVTGSNINSTKSFFFCIICLKSNQIPTKITILCGGLGIQTNQYLVTPPQRKLYQIQIKYYLCTFETIFSTRMFCYAYLLIYMERYSNVIL